MDFLKLVRQIVFDKVVSMVIFFQVSNNVTVQNVDIDTNRNSVANNNSTQPLRSFTINFSNNILLTLSKYSYIIDTKTMFSSWPCFCTLFSLLFKYTVPQFHNQTRCQSHWTKSDTLEILSLTTSHVILLDQFLLKTIFIHWWQNTLRVTLNSHFLNWFQSLSTAGQNNCRIFNIIFFKVLY